MDISAVQWSTDPGFDRELVARLQRVLNRARVIAEAPAGQLAPLGNAQAGSKLLRSTGASTLDEIGDRVLGVRDDRDLLRVVEWAEDLIEGLTHSSHVALESIAVRNRRICLEYRGKPVSELVYRERISVTLARKIRVEGFVGDGGVRRVFSARDGGEILE